jgi:hypothetical protein
MDAREIVVRKMNRDGRLKVFELLGKAVGQAVKRRICIRMVRF